MIITKREERGCAAGKVVLGVSGEQRYCHLAAVAATHKEDGLG